MLLVTLGTHAPEILTEADRDAISEAIDEPAATVDGEQAGALSGLTSPPTPKPSSPKSTVDSPVS